MRNVSLFVVLSSIAALAACSKGDPRVKQLEDRLAATEKRLEGLEKKVGAAGAVAQNRPPARPRPDPNTVYDVPIKDDDVVRGNKTAKVTIVEGFDYACPYCALSRPAVKEVLAKRPNDVRVVSKQYVVHPQTATLPALAVCAARRQGKEHEVEDAIWAKAWTETTPGRPQLDVKMLAQDAIETTAKGLGLDVAKLKADMESADCKTWLARQQTELSSIGVNGTPAFFINGRPYQGPRTFEGFNAAVDEALKKQGS